MSYFTQTYLEPSDAWVDETYKGILRVKGKLDEGETEESVREEIYEFHLNHWRKTGELLT